MDITLTTGEMLVTNDNGDTNVINLTEVTDVSVHRSREFVQTPTLLVDPAPLATAITITTNFYVYVHTSDGRYTTIPMGGVANQAGWTNSQAGANAARTAIQAAFN